MFVLAWLIERYVLRHLVNQEADITIPNGATGQIKILLTTVASGGSYTLRSNVANNANILFANVGDTATIIYTNSKWFMIGGTARVV
jgi:hypothetical protein